MYTKGIIDAQYVFHHRIEYDSAIKKNEIMKYVTKVLELENNSSGIRKLKTQKDNMVYICLYVDVNQKLGKE